MGSVLVKGEFVDGQRAPIENRSSPHRFVEDRKVAGVIDIVVDHQNEETRAVVLIAEKRVPFNRHGGGTVPVLLDAVRERQNLTPDEIGTALIHGQDRPVGVAEIGSVDALGKALVVPDLRIVLERAKVT